MTALWIEETVDLVGHHRILHQVTYYESAMEGPVWECHCGERAENTLPNMATAQREARHHTDTKILAALADAGLLLQPGGETTEERRHRRPAPDLGLCVVENHRCTLIAHHEVRAVHRGAWLPVEGGAS
jgi:hypothetical protein